MKNSRNLAASQRATAATIMARVARSVRHFYRRGGIDPSFFLGGPIVKVVSRAAGYCVKPPLGFISHPKASKSDPSTEVQTDSSESETLAIARILDSASMSLFASM